MEEREQRRKSRLAALQAKWSVNHKAHIEEVHKEFEKRFGVNIPETDYAQLVTLDNVLDYLLARLGRAGT